MSLKQPGLKVIALAERLIWNLNANLNAANSAACGIFQQIWAESGSIHLF